jgi:hypothetical protein
MSAIFSSEKSPPGPGFFLVSPVIKIKNEQERDYSEI